MIPATTRPTLASIQSDWTSTSEVIRPPHPALMTMAVLFCAVAVGALATVAPAVAGLGAVAAVGALVVLARPVVSVLVVTAVVPVISGVRRGLPVPGLRPAELLVLMLLGAALVSGWTGWRPRWSVLDWATLAYTSATVLFVSLGALSSGYDVGVGTVVSLLLPAQFLLLSRTLSVTLVTPDLRARALRLLLQASVLVSVSVILQYLDVGPVRSFLASTSGSDNLGNALQLGFGARATGPFDHWHVLAGYLLPIVLVGVALLLDRGQRVMSVPGLAVCTGLAVTAIALTFSFTPVFGVVAGCLLIGMRARRLGLLLRVAAVVLVVIGLLLGPSIGDRVGEQFDRRAGSNRSSLVPQTIDYRFEVWQDQYLPAVEERPIIGYGPELPDSIDWLYSESLYLTLQLQGGIPLLLVYAALVWAFLAAMRPHLRSDDAAERAAASAVSSLILVLIPMQMVFPYLASPGLAHVLWLLAGVALAGRNTALTGPVTTGPVIRAEAT